MATYEGRLELTWTNKALRLLAGEDGGYGWAAPADYRVAEVRLLHDAGTVGEVGPAGERARDNLLIRGDALNALTTLIELPEFGREYVRKVKLAYLDPPFNTQQAFAQYDDALEYSVRLGHSGKDGASGRGRSHLYGLRVNTRRGRAGSAPGGASWVQRGVFSPAPANATIITRIPN